jgi:hypothetical protein
MDASFEQHGRPKPTQASTARNVLGFAVLVLLAAAVGTCALYLRAHRPLHALPPSPTKGWQMRGSMEGYAATDMYLKVDGAADTYLRFNAQRLRFATYAQNGPDPAVIEVYCYDMASPRDARDAYEHEKPPDATAVSAGDEAYRTGGTIFFLSGDSYVRLIPTHGGESDAPAILELAQALAR